MESPTANKAPAETLTGLPDHEITQELGRGGMGVVYLATNKVMGRNEVLKVVNPQMLAEPGAMDRFLQEIRSAARLSHSNIVTAHAVLRSGESLVLTMEHIVGENLYKVVSERGPLPVANACYYIHQVAMGLQHAFEKGMVHRDIKPDNLMLAREGKKHIVKILDFGLAKVTREKEQQAHNLTGAGKMMGTPDYIAPEQILDAAKADIRADIYSLGCTLYFLLTGSPPFQGGSLYEKLQAHMTKAPTSVHQLRNEVPPELAAIVDKMMAKDAAARFQKPAEVAQALLPFVKGVKALGPGEQKPGAAGDTKSSSTIGEKPRADAYTLVPSETPRKTIDAPPKRTMIETEAPKVSQPRSKTSPSQAKPAARSGMKILLVGGGIGVGLTFLLVLGVLGLWVGGVFRVKTPEGILVVQVNEPNADVFVDGERMTVAWGKDGKQTEIRVKPGTRKVQVKKQGFSVEGQELDFRDGDRRIFTATLTPSAPTAGNGDQKRALPAQSGDSGTKPPAEGAGFVQLFNGKDKAGWRTHPSQPGNWRVVNGILIGSGPMPSHLYTEKGDYKDFHLRAETRINQGGNSGIFFRALFGPRLVKKGLAGPNGFEAQINSTHVDPSKTGSLYTSPGGAIASVRETLVAPGAWCTLEVIAQGGHIVIKVNGKITADYMDHFRVYATGHLALQQHNPQTVVEFRRIEIKDLTNAPVPTPAPIQPPPVTAPKLNAFVPLFNGINLEGWQTHFNQPGNWRVQNGILIGSGPSPSHLYTTRGDYQDFHLRMEARSGGLTGAYFRSSFGPRDPANKPMYPFGYNAKIDKNRLGGLIIQDGMTPGLIRSFVPFVPAGQWVTVDVVAQGERITIAVNGKMTADYTDQQRRFIKGHIAMQRHGAKGFAEFRRIEIKELNASPPPAPMPVQPPPAVAPSPAPTPKEEPFTPLLNGKDLTGWKLRPGHTAAWRVVNGVLTGPDKAAGYLNSDRDNLKNFQLRAKVRINDNSDGGIYLRSPDNAQKKHPDGYKILLKSNKLDLRKSGSLFNGFDDDLAVFQEDLVVPGKWFELDVIAFNDRIVVKIDGKQTASYVDTKQLLASGRIVLEQANAASTIEFEKIEIRDLGADFKLPMAGALSTPATDPGPSPAKSPDGAGFNPKPAPQGGTRVVMNLKGALRTTDPFDIAAKGVKRGRVKVHAIRMEAGKAYVISLNSKAFDAFLRLQDPFGKTIALNDDGGGRLNARIVHRCQATGSYRILASSFNGKLGPYQLIVQESP